MQVRRTRRADAPRSVPAKNLLTRYMVAICIGREREREGQLLLSRHAWREREGATHLRDKADGLLLHHVGHAVHHLLHVLRVVERVGRRRALGRGGLLQVRAILEGGLEVGAQAVEGGGREVRAVGAQELGAGEGPSASDARGQVSLAQAVRRGEVR